jgi:hypothetical protein
MKKTMPGNRSNCRELQVVDGDDGELMDASNSNVDRRSANE